ncbi:unnamed protein product [Peronospora effusa]|nr:unnamed protein product [Peronospora effusa]
MESIPLALQRVICSFAAAPELIPHDMDSMDDFHSIVNFATQFTEPFFTICNVWRMFVTRGVKLSRNFAWNMKLLVF